MELNYQQLLAEVYDDNSKNILVHHGEYDDEEQPPYEKFDYEENELSDQDEFNKFHGDRNKPEHVIKPKSKNTHGGDVTHKTHVRTVVLNIDGAFRGNIVPYTSTLCNGAPSEFLTSNVGTLITQATTPSWFTFNGSRLYKNITSVKLTSLEFNNSFYTFSTDRGNTIFFITLNGNSTRYQIQIPEGNYSTYSAFALAIKNALNGISSPPVGYPTFDVQYDSVAHNLLITGAEFLLEFPSSQANPYGNGIGYNMGFLLQSYDTRNTVGNLLALITSDQSPNIFQDSYIYLQINDWNLVEHQSYGQTYYPVFAKIPLNGPKNTIIFDNNYLNSSTKEYVFQQPTNLQRFEIRMIDVYGVPLDLRGTTFSMTLELQEVNNSAVYEKLLEL